MDSTSNPISTPGAESTAITPVDPTDRPIPVWPEGVLAVIAAALLLAIGFRHRTWITRKVQDCQRTVNEFQKHGGLEEITQVAQHASELLKSAKG